ncbi:MAG: DinB family protein, partial [Candidatus Thorarchaeota archaeon]
MDKASIDSLFQYHFEFNRRLFDYCTTKLSERDFKKDFDYSLGSIRNLFVHIMSVDDRWFSGLRKV